MFIVVYINKHTGNAKCIEQTFKNRHDAETRCKYVSRFTFCDRAEIREINNL